ncbi:MAG: hypothetical protein Q8P86_02110 [bacterium]|nr:hypothetical protein [bacterium]
MREETEYVKTRKRQTVIGILIEKGLDIAERVAFLRSVEDRSDFWDDLLDRSREEVVARVEETINAKRRVSSLCQLEPLTR